MGKFKGVIAGSYDRFLTRKSLLPDGLLGLVKSLKVREIIEFGAGTGTVAVGLSLEGYDVTGVDFSPEMLKKARQKAKSHNSETVFINGNIIEINLQKQFDLLLCLGNTLPIIQSARDSRKLLKNCAKHLKPGGSLVFQLLNYDRILKARPKTFGTEILDDVIRIKQYRYGKTLIDFVVSLIDISKIPPKITVRRGKIRPWIKSDLSRELKTAGFGKIRAFGSYSKERFSQKSKDLIMVCERDL
ncbi:MAG: class I SAM-dependent methyltransferase [candidate division Zixibacteria bacterium]